MIYPIPPGLFCVPAAIVALTGADIESVVVPAINRHSGYKYGLHDTVPGVTMGIATKVLNELGYNVRNYRVKDGSKNAHISTWATRSKERWPDRAILVATKSHCLVIYNGRVYDNWSPHGPTGDKHPFANTTVVWAALIQRRYS